LVIERGAPVYVRLLDAGLNTIVGTDDDSAIAVLGWWDFNRTSRDPDDQPDDKDFTGNDYRSDQRGDLRIGGGPDYQ
jgi:hypothetical protein